MKYLIMEDFSGQPVPCIFPRRVDHADMREQLPYIRTLSRGCLEYSGSSLSRYGGCASQGIKANPGDAAIIAEDLRKHDPV